MCECRKDEVVRGSRVSPCAETAILKLWCWVEQMHYQNQDNAWWKKSVVNFSDFGILPRELPASSSLVDSWKDSRSVFLVPDWAQRPRPPKTGAVSFNLPTTSPLGPISGPWCFHPSFWSDFSDRVCYRSLHWTHLSLPHTSFSARIQIVTEISEWSLADSRDSESEISVTTQKKEYGPYQKVTK